MKDIIKNYYKWGTISLATLIWVFLLGPKMLSGSTELILIWFGIGLFVIIPFLFVMVYNQFFKEKKDEQNS